MFFNNIYALRASTYKLNIPQNCKKVNIIEEKRQGNSIYFLGKKRISRNKLGSKAALNINFFLLILPY